MFQAEVGNLDTRDEPHVSCWGHLVQLGQDLPGVRGEGHQHGKVGQRHEGHIGLRIGPGLGVGDQVYSILNNELYR